MKKLFAMLLSICLIITNIQIPAFADNFETEGMLDALTKDAETASFSYTEKTYEDHVVTQEGESIQEYITLEARTSDGVLVTMKAEAAAFVPLRTATPSNAEAGTASPSDAKAVTASPSNAEEGTDGDVEAETAAVVSLRTATLSNAGAVTASPSNAEEGTDDDVEPGIDGEVEADTDSEVEAAYSEKAIGAEEFDPGLLTLVAEVTGQNEEETAEKALENLTKDDNIASRKTYDIYVLYDGKKTDPMPGKKVEVSFTLSDTPSGADEVTVYHHAEDGVEKIIEEKIGDAAEEQDEIGIGESKEEESAVNAEKGYEKETVSEVAEDIANKDSEEYIRENETDSAEESDALVITGETDSFSLYTIDFTYADKTINVPVGTTKEELSELLSGIGITDEITDAVACSDEDCAEPSGGNIVKNDETELFKVYQENGIWYIDSMNSFGTVHGLLVTTENGQYKIRVTDSQATVYYSYPVYNDETIGAASGIKEWKTGETSNYEELTQKDPYTRWTWGDPAKETWIVVRGNFRYRYGIKIAGNVHLILVDGCKLYVSYVRFSYAGYHGRPGIEVTQDNSLTIYAGSMSMSVSGSGELKAVGNVNTNISTDYPLTGSGAGIGGGDFCGGKDFSGGKDGKNITINGGTITAIGGEDAAGIGGGKNGSGSNIIINGGTVYATSRLQEDYSPQDVVGVSDFYNGVEGAGIGGGEEGSAKDIIINGGTVTAIPGSGGDAAGIGGGNKGDAENITINGGTVTTTIVTLRDTGGAGIGSGQDGIGSNITITGGTVSAIGGKKGGAGIGGGNGGSAHDITISGGTVNATGGEEGGAGIGGGKDGDGTGITISGGDVNATSGEEGGAGIGGGKDGSGSNIRADISEVVKAGDKKNPTNVIDHTDDTDLSKVPDFAGKRYVTTIFLPTVYYDANGGAGEMAEERAYDGKLSLPASGFTPPEGKEFIGWAVGSPEAEVSPTATTVNITGNTIIYALWGTNVCRRNFIVDYVNYPSVQVAVKAAAGTDPVEIEMIRDSEENVIIENGKNITLDLNGFVLKGTGSGSVITNYGNLTIKDSNSAQQKNYFTVDDRGIWKFDPDRTGIGIYAFDTVSGLKKDGAPTTQIPTSLSTIAVSGGCITGGHTTNGSGGGICNESYLTLEGGIITGNSTEISADDHPYGGGGVYNGGSMSLEGGAVIGNVSYRTAGTASHYGGGIYSSAASIFYMDGGIVSCNKATDDGNKENGCGGGAALFGSGSINGGSVSSNAASGSGGGVYNSGSMQFNNATISYNVAHDAGGMYNSSNVQMGGSAKIAENEADLEGGGVYNAGIFSMWGGSILSNTASSGGGVCNGTAAQFTMEHGSISGNTAATTGGGVYNCKGTYDLTGGSISSNEAKQGGGVFSEGTFNMSGGSIVSNTAEKSGGGVYVNLQGMLKLSGGSISSNTASNGGGVSVFSQAGMQVGGSARVTGNTKGTGAGTSANNVFLPTGRVITVSAAAALSGNASIGVTKSIPEGSSSVAITGTNSENYSSCFTSDNSSYCIVNDFDNSNTVNLATKTIELGTQSGSITEGKGGTATYSVEAKPEGATVDSPVLKWVGTAPAGVTYSCAGGTLTLSVPKAVKCGTYSFYVKDGGSISNESKLIVISGQNVMYYRYPEYKTSGKPSSGIAKWVTGTVGEGTLTEYTVIDNNSSALSELKAGWYVVTGNNVKLSSTVTVTGEVHLILADGCKIEIDASVGEETTKAGICVSGEDNSLTVYAGNTSDSIAKTGKLTATGAYYGAGIGGGYYGTGSNIIINGGTVTANGGNFGAGIGGGFYGGGSDIAINDGIVEATGGSDGAGIGGNSAGGSNITINGGEVTATGGTSGAGIGGGGNGSGSDITVNGGTVTAAGGTSGAAIGGGLGGIGSNIIFAGGKVTATGGADADGIGNGNRGNGSRYIYAADTVMIQAGDSALYTEVVVRASRNEDIADGLKGKTYATAGPASKVSFDANGGTGKMADLQSIGGNLTLPENGFTAPIGKELIGWAFGSAAGECRAPGTVVTITQDWTLYAVWGAANVCKIGDRVYPSVQDAVKDASGTTTNPVEIVMIADSKEDVTIANGKYITLDLNGFVLKGTGNGNVITNNGMLTITDSNATKKHYFTVDECGLWVLTSVAAGGGNYIFNSADGLLKAGSSELPGIPATGSIIAVSGGCITGGNNASGSGGGVYSSAAVTLKAGNIVGNNATNGGGIYNMYSDSLTVSGGAIIGNTAVNGGGVHNAGVFSMYGSAFILGNTATGEGGGVTNTGEFLMYDNATISSNKASSHGGGVYFDKGTVSVGNKAQVTGNTVSDGKTANNIYLTDGMTISIKTNTGQKLQSGASFGVTTKNDPTAGSPIAITGTNSADYSSCFFADNSSFHTFNDSEQDNRIMLGLSETKKYAVTLDANGGTAGSVTGVTAFVGIAMPAITGIDSLPNRKGYGFTGYYDAVSGGKQYYNADGTSAAIWDKAEDTTLYAQWTANSYTVKLDGNGATTPGTESVTAIYGSAMPAAAMPTKTGYSFKGYYDAIYGGKKYYSADGTSAALWDKTSDTALYAQWTKKKTPLISDLTLKASDGVYAGTGKPASFTGKAGMGTITVKYAAAKTLASAQWSDNVPKKANAADEKYYVKAVIAEGDSYASAELICEDWKFTISPAKLTVIGTTVKNKIYDGTTAATVSRGQLVGKKGTDQVFIGSATGIFDSKDAGEGKKVTVSYTIIGADAGNYTAPPSSEFAATIAQKTINVEAQDKQTRIGAELAALTYTYEPELYEGDSFSGELSTTADKNTAGIYEIMQNTLTAGENYWISYTKGTYTVTAKEVQTLSFDTKSVAKTYGDSAFTQKVNGAKTTVTYSGSNSAVAKVNASTGEVTIRNAGSCLITAYAGESETYAANQASYELTVERATVTVKADDKSKTYGKTDPELTATVKGLIDEDTVTYTVSRTDGENAGIYTITPSGNAVQGNYLVTYETGTFTIHQAEISTMRFNVTAPAKNATPATEVKAGVKTYTGSNVAWDPSDTTFNGGIAYKITFTAALTDTVNYKLADSVTVKVNGQDAAFTKATGATSYIFPATESGVLTSIAVKTAPTKTTYTYGDAVDLAGLVLTLTYDDQKTAELTYQGHESQITVDPDKPEVATTELTISYEGKTTTQSIKMNPAKLEKPVASATEFTYSGKLLGPVVTGYDETTMTVRGNRKAVAAGSYRLIYALKDRNNYSWADGTTADVIVDWSIAKAEGKIKAPKAKDLTYNGSDQTLITAGSSTTGTVKYSLKESGPYTTELPCGNTAGSYDVWYYAEGDRNHNDTARTKVTVTIARAEIAVPSAVTGLIYNKTKQTGVAAGTGYTLTGNTAINAGSYTATARPDSNHKWADDSTADVRISWTIGKATYDMSGISFADKTVSYDGKKKYLVITGDLPEGVTVRYEGNGKISAGSYTVTAKFSGDVVNYKAVPDKTARLTITAAPERGSSATTSTKSSWVRGAKGWRLLLPDNTYAKDVWYELDNPYATGTQEKRSWFRFGTDGYMLTGWYTDKDGLKYYLNPENDGTQGRMLHGKHKIDGKEYEFSEVHDGHFGHLIEKKTR